MKLRRVVPPPPRSDATVIGSALLMVAGLGILAGLATPRCVLELALGVTIVVLVVRAKLVDYMDARAAHERRRRRSRAWSSAESCRPETHRAE